MKYRPSYPWDSPGQTTNHAFTFVEVFIVMAIIALMAAISFAVFS